MNNRDKLDFIRGLADLWKAHEIRWTTMANKFDGLGKEEAMQKSELCRSHADALFEVLAK